MNKMWKLVVCIMMVFAQVNMLSVNAQSLQPLEITKLKFEGKSIEKERASEDRELVRIYNDIKTKIPTLSKNEKEIILPTVSNDKYEISLYGSSNKAVIDLDGKVTQPLEDMRVNLFYKVTNKETKENLHMDDPIVVKVNGQYQDGEQKKYRPQVMPGIREWKGNEGRFVFDNSIVIDDENMRQAAKIIQYYISDVARTEVTIKTGKPSKGDIFLQYDKDLSVGNEGYEMVISDIVSVKALGDKGLIYAGATISQMLMQSTDNSMAKGMMRDYPQYDIRSMMLDVARFYMPLEYLQEVSQYAAFFKLNEIHVHINDDGGEQSTAFRVESKKYPKINNGIKKEEMYTQEAYKAYQKYVKQYGIDVVTEIDSPAHCASLNFVNPDIMLDGNHINLSKKEARDFMKSLFDEFLDGKDPVFQNKKFNIGTDEYPKGHNELMRDYMDEMIKYVNSKGYSTRLWSGLNVKGESYGGDTPVTNEAIFHLWSLHFANLQVMLEGEYPFINNNDGTLYTVPGAGYYNDYLNVELIYNTWQAGSVGNHQIVQAGHPLLKGSETAFWYDIKTGMSQFDVFDRVKDQIALMSEKNWFGEKLDYQTYEQFTNRRDRLMNISPGTNPSRYVTSETELVALYDFSHDEGYKVTDQSVNHYDGFIKNLIYDKENKGRLLDGKGYVQLPFESIGFNYSVHMSVYISSATPQNALLFNGRDGQLYVNYEGTNKLAYVRKGYVYYFDYELPTDTLLNLTLTCDNTNLNLYVDGVFIGSGQYYGNQHASKLKSSTFVLPCEQVGSGIKGYIRYLSIYNTINESIAQKEQMNVALNKDVEVSSVEGGYNDDGSLVYPQFNPRHIVDGNYGTRNSLGQNDEKAWIIVDLKDEYIVDDIVVYFNEAPKAYKMLVSTDKEQWQELYTIDFGSSQGTRVTKKHHFDTFTKARYVKYQQIERFDSPQGYGKYSGNMTELEVYGISYKEIGEVINKAESIIKKGDGSNYYKILEMNLNELKEAMNGGQTTSVKTLCNVIKSQINQYESGQLEALDTDKSKLKKLINEKLDEKIYDEGSFNKYLKAKELGLNIYADLQATQDRIDIAVKQIESAKNSLSVKPAFKISSNGNIYENHIPLLAFDGSELEHSAYWQQSYQKEGDYILVEFRDPFDLKNVRIFTDNYDYLRYGELQISYDGSSFETVKELEAKKDQRIELEPAKKVKAIRIICTQKHEANWWKVNEIVFNDELLVDKNVLKHEIDKSKTINPKDYSKVSYETYANVLSRAEDIYKDDHANQIVVNNMRDKLKEAFSELNLLTQKTQLEAYLNNKLDSSLYTKTSYRAYINAYDVANKAYNSQASQKDVNEAIWNVREAILKLVDVNDLKELIGKAQDYKSEDYTKDSYALLMDVLNKAKDHDDLTQLEVDQLYTELKSAMDALVKSVDKYLLSELITHIQSLNKENYTKQSYELLMKEYEKGIKVFNSESVTQDEVNVVVATLEKAIKQLVRIKDEETNKPPIEIKPIEPTFPSDDSHSDSLSVQQNSQLDIDISDRYSYGSYLVMLGMSMLLGYIVIRSA